MVYIHAFLYSLLSRLAQVMGTRRIIFLCLAYFHGDGYIPKSQPWAQAFLGLFVSFFPPPFMPLPSDILHHNLVSPHSKLIFVNFPLLNSFQITQCESPTVICPTLYIYYKVKGFCTSRAGQPVRALFAKLYKNSARNPSL